MNGYGQQMITPEQYAQALTAFDTLQGRQDMQQQIAQTGNPYALIGSALSNLAANKLGKFKDTSITDASEQIRQFQEQKAAELQSIKEAKAQKEAQAAYERKKADELEKFQREQGGKKELAQLNAQLRPQQQGFNERMFNQLSPEQKQSYMNQFAGVQKQGNQLFTSEEQALISQGAVTPEQLVEVKRKEALGIKDASVAEKKKADAKQSVLAGIQNLKAHVQEKGTEWGGSKAKSMKTAYTDLLMRAKDAYDMGALAGPDLGLLQELISDPTSIGSNMNIFTGASNILAQLDEAEKILGGAQQVQPEQQTTQPNIQSQNNMLFKYSSNQ